MIFVITINFTHIQNEYKNKILLYNLNNVSTIVYKVDKICCQKTG